MGYSIDNFDLNDDVELSEQYGPLQCVEYLQDLSCRPSEVQLKYYMSQMYMRRRQLKCELSDGGVILQQEAMQWYVGNVKQTTGIKGVGDAISKAFKGKVTGEDIVKPEYVGTGVVVTEPTYNHYLFYKLSSNMPGLVIQDWTFAACEDTIKLSVKMRKNISSAVAGNEGLFSLKLKGSGYVVLESRVPKEELITVNLNNDVLKVDGPYAIAWSDTLDFTVERSGKTLMGSAVSGEGPVNVYRGTGMVIMMPQV